MVCEGFRVKPGDAGLHQENDVHFSFKSENTLFSLKCSEQFDELRLLHVLLWFFFRSKSWKIEKNTDIEQNMKQWPPESINYDKLPQSTWRIRNERKTKRILTTINFTIHSSSSRVLTEKALPDPNIEVPMVILLYQSTHSGWFMN